MKTDDLLLQVSVIILSASIIIVLLLHRKLTHAPFLASISEAAATKQTYPIYSAGTTISAVLLTIGLYIKLFTVQKLLNEAEKLGSLKLIIYCLAILVMNYNLACQGIIRISFYHDMCPHRKAAQYFFICSYFIIWRFCSLNNLLQPAGPMRRATRWFVMLSLVAIIVSQYIIFNEYEAHMSMRSSIKKKAGKGEDYYISVFSAIQYYLAFVLLVGMQTIIGQLQ